MARTRLCRRRRDPERGADPEAAAAPGSPRGCSTLANRAVTASSHSCHRRGARVYESAPGAPGAVTAPAESLAQHIVPTPAHTGLPAIVALFRRDRVRGFLRFAVLMSPPARERLDSVVGRIRLVGSRAQAQRLIDSGRVKASGRLVKASYRTTPSDRIVVAIPEARPCRAVPEDLAFDIMYEDSDVIVVNKPRGMVVHPGAGNPTGTLVNGLLYHCHDLSGVGGVLRPGIVHRIDKDTSGLLVAAKNDTAHLSLAAQLKDHSMDRVYLAVVAGEPRAESGSRESQLGRHRTDRRRMASVARGGKRAVTHWRVVERLGGFAVLECRLETGRTHQIRVHMSELGLPLVGDPVYGPGGKRAVSRAQAAWAQGAGQALHAAVLGFTHPRTGVRLMFEAPLPPDIVGLLQALRGR